MLPQLTDLDLKDKRVLLRVDFNVPLDENGHITDRSRIEAALPTIRYCLEHGAKIALASHLGRPKGKATPKYSLLPVAKVLTELLSVDVFFPENCIGNSVRKLVSELRSPKEIVLLENLRFHAEEEANNDDFAQHLAKPFDTYITDAFGSLHRAHASTAGVLNYIPQCAVGLLVKKELDALEKIRTAPERPFAAILGGAKVSDKIGLIEELSQKVDMLIIGGGMAYTFLAAQGHSVGKSLVEENKIQLAKRIIKRLETKNVPLYLPVDHVVVPAFPDPSLKQAETLPGAHIIRTGEMWTEGMGLDIGPETALRYHRALSGVKSVLWNGPMGVFEVAALAKGTLAVGKAVAQASRNAGAFSVVGGGDSVAAIEALGLASDISHLSTGGGATLAYLETGDLPGLAAIREAVRKAKLSLQTENTL